MRLPVRPANCLKVLSNEYRLLVLCSLLDTEKSVGELQAIIGISQSALSQHLARLRHDGLVKTRRQSQTIYYSVAGDKAVRVLALLYELYCDPESQIESTDNTTAELA